jgi:hypothetical protein
MGYSIACNMIGEVLLRQSNEALGIMESIFNHGTEDISEIDIGSSSQWDEDEEHSRTNTFDEDYEASWKHVWSQ